MKRLTILIIMGVVLVSLVLAFILEAPSGLSPFKSASNIAIVYIEGPLTGGTSSSGLLGHVEGADTVTSHLQAARKDDSVRAVVLRIDTPGGSVGATQEIARQVDKLKSSGKKVVASLGDMGVSGGYWIASSADLIMANPGTITGSIGVIMQFMDYVELYQKIGVTPHTIKSGEYKDTGSSYRSITEEEQRLLQSMVDDIHKQFVEQVSEGRNLPATAVYDLADGRVFTGSQAKELGLVDVLGNFEDALDKAAELAGMERYNIVEYGRLGPLQRFLKAFSLESRVPIGLWSLFDAYRGILKIPD